MGLGPGKLLLRADTAGGRTLGIFLAGIRDEEKVISILPMNKQLIDNPDGHYLIFSTLNGRIKRSRLSEYVKINRNGKYAIKFAEGASDSLVSVRSATEGIMLYWFLPRAMHAGSCPLKYGKELILLRERSKLLS